MDSLVLSKEEWNALNEQSKQGKIVLLKEHFEKGLGNIEGSYQSSAFRAEKIKSHLLWTGIVSILFSVTLASLNAKIASLADAASSSLPLVTAIVAAIAAGFSTFTNLIAPKAELASSSNQHNKSYRIAKSFELRWKSTVFEDSTEYQNYIRMNSICDEIYKFDAKPEN